ncbi:hypothetical protein CCACVL1_17641 [Corchorus capsularis]|uniref:Uncharacterized protein n=1 Tax=Corchorus capsularis TaxID=210143 RepID=A0A1R3HR58_COCAP|nr:hypothetical protein CCACVL1_17641 [Corchorus capsularis]
MALRPQWESNPRPFDPKSNALIHCAMRSDNEDSSACFIEVGKLKLATQSLKSTAKA